MTDPRRAEPTVRLLDRGDRREVVAVLARAFYPDPLFGFFARNRLHEYRLLASVFDTFTADAAPFRQTFVAEVDDSVVGAAVWLPPGAMPRSTRREVTLNAGAARVLATARNRRAGFKLLDAVDKVHPHEPHWYLFLLGTDPLVQGRGVGGRLLQPVLDRCDAEGLPAYLETQKEANLAFYGRHGFAVEQLIEPLGAPRIWTMRRPAKG